MADKPTHDLTKAALAEFENKRPEITCDDAKGKIRTDSTVSMIGEKYNINITYNHVKDGKPYSANKITVDMKDAEGNITKSVTMTDAADIKKYMNKDDDKTFGINDVQDKGSGLYADHIREIQVGEEREPGRRDRLRKEMDDLKGKSLEEILKGLPKVSDVENPTANKIALASNFNQPSPNKGNSLA